MKLKLALIFAAPMLFWGCASQFAALQNNRQHDIALEELRVEVADLKHGLHASEVEVRLLEEKLDHQNQSSDFNETVTSLQRKISLLEKNQEKLAGEVRSLTAYANQTTASLAQYRDQIQELASNFEALKGIKTTLSSLSKSMGGSQTAYKVKAGDSLEKISKRHNVSVESIKRMNHLSSDKIVVGQELILPNE